MSTHTATQTTLAEPTHVLEVLTDPSACARWSPIEFTTDQAPGEHLRAGSRASLQGRIACRSVTFEIDVLTADERGLSLNATGPVGLAVDYRLTPSGCGTLIEAQIMLAQARGISGALAARATSAALAAGALRFALRAIAAEAEQLRRAADCELAAALKRRAAGALGTTGVAGCEPRHRHGRQPRPPAQRCDEELTNVLTV